MAAGLILCGSKALLQSATQKNGNMNINTEIFPFSLLSCSLFCALNGCFVHEPYGLASMRFAYDIVVTPFFRINTFHTFYNKFEM